MQTIRRGIDSLLGAVRIVAAVLLVASVVINFANIIGRYFFSVSLQWAEEVMLFLMIACVFLGAGLVGWSGKHIRMDVIVSLFPPPIRRALELFAEIVTIATSLAVAIFAWPAIAMLARFDQRSQAANIPLVIPQAMLPLGLSLMALLIALRLLLRVNARADRPGDVAD
ncbi:MAG TPA: TRAP transporter small permease [Stellaceae bacterium]|nr:TRAP transporter small permease [Stellaceae bacterium]